MQAYPNYLVVNHVPLGRSSRDDTFLIGDMWLEDLRAQQRALGDRGRLLLATPLVDELDNEASGSFNCVEFRPREEGIAYFPLPAYCNAKEFVCSLPALLGALGEAVQQSDIVQADYGGHPLPLGRLVWDLAGRQKKKRIWVFDGADPLPRMELGIQKEANRFKRFLKKSTVKQNRRFFSRAVSEADLVFSHNEAVLEHLHGEWNHKCHLLHRSFVRDESLVNRLDLQRRLGEGRGPLRLIVAGRQIAIKATDHVLKALAQARSRGVDIELVVLGEGEELGAYRRLSTELGLDAVVDFRGRVPYGEALFAEWDRCDAMVIANLTAEISRNFFLSLARGLPLVMYSNPGTDALLQESGAGLLVERGSVEGLAAAMEELCRNRDLLHNYAAKGVDFASQFTLDRCHRQRADLALACMAA